MNKANVISAFLVEDREDIRGVLVEAMEEIAPLKFIGQADTEDSAKRWLGEHPGNWDLAIVDLFLSSGSGFGVLKDCQNRKPGQKVVVLTNYNQANILQRCRDLGADEVFDKAQDVEKLVQFCKTHAAHLDAGLVAPNHVP
jgi:DNA-binding NarL/FixJ family response regulator